MMDVTALEGALVREADGRTGRIGSVSLPWITLLWEEPGQLLPIEETFRRSDPRIDDGIEILTATEGWAPLSWLVGAKTLRSRDPKTEERAVGKPKRDLVQDVREALELIEAPQAHQQKHSPLKNKPNIGLGAEKAKKRSKSGNSWTCNKDPEALGITKDDGEDAEIALKAGKKAYQQHCVKTGRDGKKKIQTIWRGQTGARKAYMDVYNPRHKKCVDDTGKQWDCGSKWAGDREEQRPRQYPTATPERQAQVQRELERVRSRVTSAGAGAGLSGGAKKAFQKLSKKLDKLPEGQRKTAAAKAAGELDAWSRNPEKAKKHGKGLSALEMLDLRDAVRKAHGVDNPADRELTRRPGYGSSWNPYSDAPDPKHDPGKLKGLGRTAAKAAFDQAKLGRIDTKGNFSTVGERERAITKFFGRNLSIDQVAELAGWRGAVMKSDATSGGKSKTENNISISIGDRSIDFTVTGPAISSQSRTLTKYNDGSYDLHNNVFRDRDTDTGSKNNAAGAGPAMILSEIRALEQAGIADKAQISVGALSSGKWIGGYVWARTGFQFDLLDHERRRFAESAGIPADQAPKTSQELMKHPQGAKWWRDNHRSFQGTIDPKEGSVARQILESYMNAKAPYRLGQRSRRPRGSGGVTEGRQLLTSLRYLLDEAKAKDAKAPKKPKKSKKDKAGDQWNMDAHDEELLDKAWASLSGGAVDSTKPAKGK